MLQSKSLKYYFKQRSGSSPPALTNQGWTEQKKRRLKQHPAACWSRLIVVKQDKYHWMQLFPAFLWIKEQKKQRSKANPDTHKQRDVLIKATIESSLHVYILHYLNSTLQLNMDWWNFINKINSSIPIQNCLFKTICSHQGLPHRKSLCRDESIAVLKKKLKPCYIQCIIYHRMHCIRETHFRMCCNFPLRLEKYITYLCHTQT